jgi:hypothetical protein
MPDPQPNPCPPQLIPHRFLKAGQEAPAETWEPLICQRCGANHTGEYDPLCSKCWERHTVEGKKTVADRVREWRRQRIGSYPSSQGRKARRRRQSNG